MRLIATALVLCLVGCASGELDSSSAVLESKEDDKGAAGKDIDTSDDATEPAPKSKDEDSKTPADDESDDGSSGGTSQQPPPVKPTSVTCTSKTGSHSSVSVLTYTDTNGTIDILSMTTLVTNSQGRNLNDLSVYVKSSSGDYEDVFDSGDILTSGKTVSITLPSNIAIQAGDALRIDTNFDEAWVPDPVASCFVNF